MSPTQAKKRQRRIRRGKPKNWCQVYVLREPDTGEIRYVGQTRQAITERLRWFPKNISKKKSVGHSLSPVLKWIDEMDDRLPIIEVIDENGVWDASEPVWIDRVLRDGHRLLNVLLKVPEGEVPAKYV